MTVDELKSLLEKVSGCIEAYIIGPDASAGEERRIDRVIYTMDLKEGKDVVLLRYSYDE